MDSLSIIIGRRISKSKLYFYAHRILLFILIIFLIIVASISLWLGLDLFKKRFGISYVDKSYFSSINKFDKNNASFSSIIQTQTYDKLTSSYLGQDAYDSSPSDNKYLWNPGIYNGTVLFLGSSSNKESRDQIDVSQNAWNRTNRSKYLYNYWKNNGPLNSYAKYMQKTFSGYVNSDNQKYWGKYTFGGLKLSGDNYFHVNQPQPISFLQKYMPYLSTYPVLSYLEPNYNVNASDGDIGKNNVLSNMLYSIYLSSCQGFPEQPYQNDDYQDSATLMKVTLHPQSKSYKQSKTDKGNNDYFKKGGYLDTEFTKASVDTNIPTSSGYSSMKDKMMIGIVHDTYFYDANGKQRTTRKLFFTDSVLNKNQMLDFMYWVFTGDPTLKTSKDSTSVDGNDPKNYDWKPYWDTKDTT